MLITKTPGLCDLDLKQLTLTLKHWRLGYAHCIRSSRIQYM